MKKSLIIAALAVAAVAMPATSSADSAQKSTAKGGDLKIKFDLVSQGHDPVRIENFKFKNFIAPCAVGGATNIEGTIPKIGLNNKEKFDAVAKTNDGKGKVIVEGQVKQNGKKTVGTLKAKGDFTPAEDCSAKVNWEAS